MNISWGGKGGWCVELTLPPSYAEYLESWESQPPETLRACPGIQWYFLTFRDGAGTPIYISYDRYYSCKPAAYTEVGFCLLCLGVRLAKRTGVLLCVLTKSRCQLPEVGESAETCRN
jgi:hypothetical protein